MVKGQQAVLLQILKTGEASTLAVVEGVRAKLPGILKMLPPGVTITPLDDASTFVRASIDDVVQEMLTAAVLAGIAVLVFVGSWRSTLIVAASILLSILSSVFALSVVGQDINRAIKRQVRPMMGFKSFWSAAVTLAGIELMHMIRKGQLKAAGRLRPASQFYSLAG